MVSYGVEAFLALKADAANRPPRISHSHSWTVNYSWRCGIKVKESIVHVVIQLPHFWHNFGHELVNCANSTIMQNKILYIKYYIYIYIYIYQIRKFMPHIGILFFTFYIYNSAFIDVHKHISIHLVQCLYTHASGAYW